MATTTSSTTTAVAVTEKVKWNEMKTNIKVIELMQPISDAAQYTRLPWNWISAWLRICMYVIRINIILSLSSSWWCYRSEYQLFWTDNRTNIIHTSPINVNLSFSFRFDSIRFYFLLSLIHWQWRWDGRENSDESSLVQNVYPNVYFRNWIDQKVKIAEEDRDIMLTLAFF